MKIKVTLITIILTLVLCSGVQADEVDDLLMYYVNRFKPETANLTISAKPDKTGRFNDIYMELEGVVIEKLRLDSLKVRMRGVQFNEPSEWKKGNVKLCVIQGW